jgi:hypothetical protein
MLKKFQMEDPSLVSTPMVVSCKLSKDDISPDVDQRTYQSMIGSLVYITASHPDIIQVVGMVGRYQSALKQSHVVVVTTIFKYLKGTMYNTSAISVSKNPVLHSKTKNIPIKYHFLREQVTNENCLVELYSFHRPYS